jgi:hypothetical protein
MRRTITRAFGLAAALLLSAGCWGFRLERGEAGDVRVAAPFPPRGKGGPPPWARAHGYRRKISYQYYPDHEVYYCPSRRQYVWFEHGEWRVGVALPPSITIDARHDRSYVVSLASDAPEDFHDEVRATYGGKTSHPGHGYGSVAPPGKAKGRGRGDS